VCFILNLIIDSEAILKVLVKMNLHFSYSEFAILEKLPEFSIKVQMNQLN